ncbi:hypothetical protein BGZ95_007126 [Linnemannia exigua]|uniref:Arf-GAP domain-containing protein n=1 Tax=Linnemannia exigua TaxID=604196 RepID=A0AAD4H8D8_9FUNG|nr:hypothetical protein BGZ95_007126 [Linnemannia exigua]
MSLLKLPENKKCFDCPSKVNVYANLFNNTFICEKCSGLLRELNHRVKSISASTFTTEEMSALQKGGNLVAKKIWLATWSWREYPEPDAHEVDNVRQFMRAKYVKKLWYQDPTGGSPVAAAASATPTPTSPTSAHGPNSTLAVPDRVRVISKSQSIDVNNHIASPSTPTAATPERTLSRKSSTLSSDSGSTISKSTDPSSAGSSPFYPGAQKSAQPSPSLLQNFQQQQQQQQQRRQGSFDNAMGITANNYNNVNNNINSQSVLGGQAFAATPAATETSDPFSLMTNAFSNMGMNPSLPAGINSNDAFGTQSNGGYAGQSTFSQAPLSQALSSNDFFSSFSQPSSSAALQATSSDPFSLAASGQTQHRQHQPYMNQGAFQGLDFGGGSPSLATPAAPTVSGNGAEALGGAKSFDDYLSVLGQGQQQQQPASSSVGSIYNSSPSAFSTTSSSTTSLSPQSTGSANPFGLQQQHPQQLQRAFTADYISTNTGYNGTSAAPASSGQQSNPFALFAKQPQPQPQPAFFDPFGNMNVPQQYQQQQHQQQQQQQDYFSTSGLGTSGSRSPNPFAMASGGSHGQSAALRSPFDQQQQYQYQQQQQTMQPAVIRSTSESSYNFQNAFGNSSNNSNDIMGGAAGSSTSIYESAFSMPGAPTRSMTVPATISQTGSGAGNNNTNMNDMFGQWMKPAPVAATSKYPSIDDLDPFSASLSSSSSMPVSLNAAASTSTYSNPFSLNM